MTFVIFCSDCGAQSDRGCIRKCRRCSGMTHKYLRACDCKDCYKTFREKQKSKFAKLNEKPPASVKWTGAIPRDGEQRQQSHLSDRDNTT